MSAPADDGNPYAPPKISDDEAIRAVVVEDDGAMSVRFDVTIDDLLQFSLWHITRSPAARRSFYVSWVGVPFLFIATGLILGMLTDFVPLLWRTYTIVAGIMAVLFVLRWPSQHRKIMTKNFLKMYSEGENKGAIGPHCLTIAPAFFSDVTPLTESKCKWPVVEKIETTGDAAYIYISAISAEVVPRRAFGSEEEFETFVQAAVDYWRRATEPPQPAVTAQATL